MTSINTAQAFYSQIFSIHETRLCNVITLAANINLFLNKIKDANVSFEDLTKEYPPLDQSYEHNKSLKTRITILSELEGIQKAKESLVHKSIAAFIRDNKEAYKHHQKLHLELLSLEPQLILDFKDLDKRYENIEKVMDSLVDRVKDALLQRALFGITEADPLEFSTESAETLSIHRADPIQDSGCVSPFQNQAEGSL